MTIDEIDYEIRRLEELKKEQKIKLLNDSNDTVGKYYKSEINNTIGRVMSISKYSTKITETTYKVKNIFYDMEHNEFYNDASICSENEMEFISKEEFETILDGWVDKIKTEYGIVKGEEDSENK